MGKRGPKSKFDSVDLGQLKSLVEHGYSDKEIAEFFGMALRTYLEYKQNNKEFQKLTFEWKDEADKRVERSLWERANGYSHPDTHISNYQGDVTKTEIIKHYPPDPVSMIFWLKNRHPDRWRDKQDVAMNFPQFDAIQVIPVAPKKTDDGSEPKTT